MCNLIRKIKRDTFTGYKILMKKDDKYYSSFTGQEIKVGEVPSSPKRAVRLSSYWNSSLDAYSFKNCAFYNNNFDGKTSVFYNLHRACELGFKITERKTNKYVAVLVKMTLLGELWEGSYQDIPIIASSTIEEIEEIKEIEAFEEITSY